MIIYKYDNKEYTSLTDLYKALRENNIQIFGIPATEEEWLSYGVTYEVEDPSISLEVEKNIKKGILEQAFKEIRNSSNIYVNSSYGFPINANETSIINIIGLINELEVSGKETVVFRDFNNEFHEVNKDLKTNASLKLLESGSAYYSFKMAI